MHHTHMLIITTGHTHTTIVNMCEETKFNIFLHQLNAHGKCE